MQTHTSRKGEINIGYSLGFFAVLLMIVGSSLALYGFYSEKNQLMWTGIIGIFIGFSFLITATKL